MESDSVCYPKSDNKIRRPHIGTGRQEVLLPINHKNYNFREKKNRQVIKERENLHLNTYKGDVNILRPARLIPFSKT